MFNVEIYTDGSCSGNPGPGGFGAIILWNDLRKTVCGYDKDTTNNKMELTAIIKAVEALRKPCEATIYTDSQYVITCMGHSEEWRTCKERPNCELWTMLSNAEKAGRHKLRFVKIPGHSGNYLNEQCDKIAREQTRKACHVLAGHIKE